VVGWYHSHPGFGLLAVRSRHISTQNFVPEQRTAYVSVVTILQSVKGKVVTQFRLINTQNRTLDKHSAKTSKRAT
jgi:hypothetical protein